MAWFSERDAKVELRRLQMEFMGEYCPVRKGHCIGSGDGAVPIPRPLPLTACKCYDPGRIHQYPKERAKNPDTQWAVYGPSCGNPVITGEMYVTVSG